jgi:hypothetical protein
VRKTDIESALLELGKKRGVLTFEDLNATFPAEYFPLDEMDRFLGRIAGLGIKVVETSERRRPKHRRAA